MRRTAPEAGVELRCIIERETSKAIQVSLEDHKHLGTGKFWFPLSQVQEIHRVAFTEETDRLVVSKWIMEQKIDEVSRMGEG